MLGERTEQRGLWEADRMYLDYVGKDTFYGLLASLRGQLFRDADFAEFYCLDNGRTSVPPRLLGKRRRCCCTDLRQGERRRGQGERRLRHPLEGGPGEAPGEPPLDTAQGGGRSVAYDQGKVRHLVENGWPWDFKQWRRPADGGPGHLANSGR